MSTILQSQAAILPLCERPAWKALQQHHAKMQNLHLRQLFAEDPQRGEHLAFETEGLYFDYSKNRRHSPAFNYPQLSSQRWPRVRCQ
jgi:hypothetical protein